MYISDNENLVHVSSTSSFRFSQDKMKTKGEKFDKKTKGEEYFDTCTFVSVCKLKVKISLHCSLPSENTLREGKVVL
jgi:hypothetical protein